MRWAGHVAGVEVMRMYEILVGKFERKRPLEDLSVDERTILKCILE
jgi:hypothetical protein